MAIPLLIAGAVAAGAAIVGGVIGNHLRGMERDKAEAIMRAASDEFGRIDIPKLKLLVAEQLPPSEFNKIKNDPDLRNAQMGAVSKMKEIAQNGGATLADRVAAAKISNRIAGKAGSQFARIADEKSQLGTFDGGSQLAMQLAQAQSGEQAAAESEGDIIAGMRQRADNATINSGRMAGDVRQQDFEEQARVAAANDEIQKINAQWRDSTARYNNSMTQQGFDNQMNLTKAKYGVASDEAGRHMADGDFAAQQAAGYGQAVGNAALAVGGAYGGAPAGANDKSASLSSRNNYMLSKPVYQSDPYKSQWPGEPEPGYRGNARLMSYEDDNPYLKRGGSR